MLSNYFVIDEEKVDVFQTEETLPGHVEKEPEVEKRVEHEDLLSLISQTMVEKDQLQDIREQLESRASSPKELRRIMKKMITFLDSFERILNLARQHPPSKEIDNWLKSVETIYFRLFHILEKYGLKPIDSIGKPVNLDCHDVVEYRPTKDYPADTVIQERQKGYAFQGKLLRDAKVVVAYNPSSA